MAQIKDGEGATINVQQVGDTYYDASFRGIQGVLAGLPTMEARPDDIWICGYIKTGSNLIAELLGMLLNGAPGYHGKGKMSGFIDLIGLQAVQFQPSPRSINTNFPYSMIPKDVFAKNCKIIYIVRNPKDVATSFYHHKTGATPDQYSGTFNGFLPLFLEGKLGGTTWFDHTKQFWNACKDNPNVLFVFYEDMQKDLVGGTKRIAKFIGKDFDDDFYSQVAELCKFDNLAAAMRPREPRQMWKTEAGSVYRKGVVGDWKNNFSPDQSKQMDNRFESEFKDVPDLKNRIRFE